MTDREGKKRAGSKSDGSAQRNGQTGAESGCSEADIPGFNSWMLEAFPLAASGSSLLLYYFTNFLLVCSVQLWRATAIMKRGCLLCFSLWSHLRFAVVGLVTSNKCPLLKWSP